jgi:hypothetical protein
MSLDEVSCMLDEHSLATWLGLVVLLFAATAVGLVVIVKSRAGRYVWVGEDTWGNWPLDLVAKPEWPASAETEMRTD